MTEKHTVPHLEAKASERNAKFIPRQWLERFRQFIKREHELDMAPLMKKEDITVNEWTAKEQLFQEVFIWGIGPEALYQITRADYKTEPDSIKTKYLIRLFIEYYLPKRKTTAETFSGQNKQMKKHPQNFGKD